MGAWRHIAALLYGTAARLYIIPLFIWQQNLIAPFVVLFLFALFWVRRAAKRLALPGITAVGYTCSIA